MSLWALSASLADGPGLFLPGMSAMTDGLKLAAGPALERTIFNVLGMLQVPSLAIDALKTEVARIGHVSVRRALGQATFKRLDAAVENFAERMNRSATSQHVSEQLAQVLRVQRHHQTAAEQAHAAALLRRLSGDDSGTTALQEVFLRSAGALLALCDPVAAEPQTAVVKATALNMKAAYEDLKTGLLTAVAVGGARLADTEDARCR